MNLDPNEEPFDFGFTAVDFDELSTKINEEQEKVERPKLQAMREMIQPLLENLKKNSEKDYIYWPNRIPTIEKFEAKLDDLLKPE